MSQILILKKTESYGARTAITDFAGDCSYAELLDMRLRAARSLLDFLPDGDDLNERRVAFMVGKTRRYAALKLAIWSAGGVSVPLCVSHPAKEIEYVIDDVSPFAVVCDPCFSPTLRDMCAKRRVKLLTTDEVFSSQPAHRLPDVAPSRRAMVIYTSGTTSRPKGVVTTHANIEAQMKAMIEAWEWSGSDTVLNILPMHHLHGILNLMLCPLRVGAGCEMASFSPQGVWNRLVKGGLTLFMAVPTVYAKLADFWQNAPEEKKKEMSLACRPIRLFVSGSAALTVNLSEKWLRISGHTLLERYGMTETGMILSNPLWGKRKPGFVGKPMPGVEAAVFSSSKAPATGCEEGEIMVRGEGVFLEYWRNSGATRAAFSDGWFKTGDIAARDSEGDFRIVGRESVDIIKSGGYKVSALEVERQILEKEGVSQCAVVGVRDEVWGQRVAAMIVPEDGKSLDPDELTDWLKPRIAHYKIPSIVKVTDEIPENALGKTPKTLTARVLEAGK